MRGRLEEDHNKNLFSYHMQFEVEWQIVFYDIGSAKGKLCSPEGHIFKKKGEEKDRRSERDSEFILFFFFHYYYYLPHLHHSIRPFAKHKDIETPRADVPKQYSGDIRVNAVSSYSRASSFSSSQTVITEVVCIRGS